jgi:hypothetical protein
VVDVLVGDPMAERRAENLHPPNVLRNRTDGGSPVFVVTGPALPEHASLTHLHHLLVPR